MDKAVWSTAYINRLPDSAFLYIAPGGKKDSEGKTVPRSLRYFPVRDENGKLDIPHARNAAQRIPQSTAPGLTRDKMDSLQERARRLLAEAQKTKKLSDSSQGFPYYLTADAVEKGAMPDLGDSGIQWTLEDVVPKEHRYWESTSTEVAKAVRDDLVKSNWFTSNNVVVVDFLLQKVIQKTFLFDIPEEEKILTPSQRKELAEKRQKDSEGTDDTGESEDAVIISLFKTDESTDEERFVLGVVLEPNDGTDAPLNPDTQKDVYSADEIKEACHLFMEKFQNIGDMHKHLVNKKVKLVECYIAPVTFKLTDPYGEEQTIYKGTWLMGLHVADDAMWKRVKEDNITGLSIGGSARRLPENVVSMAELVDNEDGADESDQIAA